MSIGIVLMICVGIMLFGGLIYMITMVWTNGFNSKYREFRVCSTYYEDGEELHIVYWKLLWLWHVCYEERWNGRDCAEFASKEDALQFIDKLKHPDRYTGIKKTEITEYKDE